MSRFIALLAVGMVVAGVALGVPPAVTFMHVMLVTGVVVLLSD
jgi:hypothetical protein